MWNRRVALHAPGFWSCGKFACVEFPRSQSLRWEVRVRRIGANKDTRALRNFAGFVRLPRVDFIRPVVQKHVPVTLACYGRSTSMSETSGSAGVKN
jgi:hypothetical protein